MKNIRKKLGIGMMLLGLIIVLIPSIGVYYTKQQQDKMYQSYITDQTIEVFQIMNTTFEEVTNEEKQVEKQVEKQTLNGINVIGLINIPKIDMQSVLVEGVTTKALKYAVGHMPHTAYPGEVGNCSIAGHRNYTFGSYFNRLDELEIADTIEIFYKNRWYEYKVYETFIVEPSEVEVIQPQGERQVVTLITCHPVVVGTQRLIVRGELVTTTKVAEGMVKRYNSNSWKQ